MNSSTAYHSDSSTHGFGGEVLAKLGTHYATVAMGSGHLPPDDPVLAWLLVSPLLRLFVHTIHVGHSLPQIVACLLAFTNTIQLQQGRIWSLISESPLVPNKNPFIVQPALIMVYSKYSVM